MDFLNKINCLNSDLNKIHHKIDALKSKHETEKSEYTKLINNLLEKKNQEKNDCLQKKKEILVYYNIAKNNYSLSDINAHQKPQIPNFQLLKKLSLQICSDNYYNDASAAKIIELCGSYLAYYEQMEKDIEERYTVESYNINKKIDISHVDLLNKLQLYFDEVRKIITNYMVDISNEYVNLQSDFIVNDSFYNNWNDGVSEKVFVGFSKVKVNIPQKCLDIPKKYLGNSFISSDRSILVPVYIYPGAKIKIVYNSHNENDIEKLVMLTNLLFIKNYNKKGRIAVVDNVYNSLHLLGDLALLDTIVKSPNDYSDFEVSRFMLDFEQRYNLFLKSHNSSIKPPVLIFWHHNNVQQYGYGSNKRIADFIATNALKINVIYIDLIRNYNNDCLVSSNDSIDYDYIIEAYDKITITAKGIKSEYSFPGNFKIPSKNFILMLKDQFAPEKKETEYFKRGNHVLSVPSRNFLQRKDIEISFGIDDANKENKISFEGNNFAAYIMGVAGSGKSTLLHMIICELLMKYHPDEVELWLVDFKMMEFGIYLKNTPPHIKYVLLDESEDILYDLLDKLWDEYLKRKNDFYKIGITNYRELPASDNIPVIFIIFDEFEAVSEKLVDTPYEEKIKNLLQQTRAVGFKYIFASQNFSYGAKGLNQVSRNQIQLRMAMKGPEDEIMETLSVSYSSITEKERGWIQNLEKFTTLIKSVDSNGIMHIDKYSNMFIEKNDVVRLIEMLNSNLKKVTSNYTDIYSFLDKNPVLIDGAEPKSFKSQINYYKGITVDDDEHAFFPGVPCSLSPSKHIVLGRHRSDNMLVIGSNNEQVSSVIVSLLLSLKRKSAPNVEIWAYDRNPIVKKYSSVFMKIFKVYSTLDEINERLRMAYYDAINKNNIEKIIFIIGYTQLMFEMEVYEPLNKQINDKSTDLDLAKILYLNDQGVDIDEIVNSYNSSIDLDEMTDLSYNFTSKKYNEMLAFLLQKGPQEGINFIMSFESIFDLHDSDLSLKDVRHKIIFKMPYDDACELCYTKQALLVRSLADDVFLYTDGQYNCSFRPHIHEGIPLNGWVLKGGKLCQGY